MTHKNGNIWLQIGPKWLKNGPKTVSFDTKNVTYESQVFPYDLKIILQNGSTWPVNGPIWPQNGPIWPQNCPIWLPKWTNGALKFLSHYLLLLYIAQLNTDTSFFLWADIQIKVLDLQILFLYGVGVRAFGAGKQVDPISQYKTSEVPNNTKFSVNTYNFEHSAWK